MSLTPRTGEIILPDVLSITTFADGGYNLTVTAIDGAGNRGTTVSTMWWIDTVSPDTVITSPNATASAQREFRTDHLTLTFTSPVDTVAGQATVQQYRCALDCLRIAPTCGGTGAAISSGDGLPVCLPHSTPLLQNYTANSSAVVARFSGGTGILNTADCVDSVGTAANASFHPCDSGAITFVGLQEGRHIFSVRAIDPAGNEGPTTLYGWTVDLTAPTAAFEGGAAARPPALTRSDSATFRFTADESVVTFECRLICAARDQLRYYADMSTVEQQTMSFHACIGRTNTFHTCTSGESYVSLGDAIHRFQVRAIDAAGNVQRTRDVNGVLADASTDFTWEIDRDAPDVYVIGVMCISLHFGRLLLMNVDP